MYAWEKSDVYTIAVDIVVMYRQLDDALHVGPLNAHPAPSRVYGWTVEGGSYMGICQRLKGAHNPKV